MDTFKHYRLPFAFRRRIRFDCYWHCYLNEVEKIEDILNETHTKLVYNFDTAWSPPSKWLETIASIYKDITFELEFSEPGLNFYGKKKTFLLPKKNHNTV